MHGGRNEDEVSQRVRLSLHIRSGVRLSLRTQPVGSQPGLLRLRRAECVWRTSVFFCRDRGPHDVIYIALHEIRKCAHKASHAHDARADGPLRARVAETRHAMQDFCLAEESGLRPARDDLANGKEEAHKAEFVRADANEIIYAHVSSGCADHLTRAHDVAGSAHAQRLQAREARILQSYGLSLEADGIECSASFKTCERHPRQADEQSAMELLGGISAQTFAPPMLPLRREATEVRAKVAEGFWEVI